MLRLVVAHMLLDVLLQQARPRDVINLVDVVAISLEGAQELVEPEPGMAGDMGHAQRFTWRMESGCDDDACNVVDGNHVDVVVNVGACRKLHASLDEADEEVVGVGN